MIDLIYANLASSRLEKFKQVRKGVYTFRCPYCGDSDKYKNKTRGYLFSKKSGLVFKCHNCGVGRSFGNFLKDNAHDLHDQYVLERYKAGLTGKGRNVADPEFTFSKPKFVKSQTDLPTIESLNSDHPAKLYLLSRGIPQDKLKDLYWADNFVEWANKQKPNIITPGKKDHPRVIIPLTDKTGNWFGFQGRTIDPKNPLRYITIMLDEDKPKVFGLNKVNENETIYVTEGPLDSLFLRNSVAMCGADVHLNDWGISNIVWVYDNEPRNTQIVARYASAISRGERIVIWPSGVTQKDINDMVLAGLNVQDMVESNVYQGLEAQVKFTEWKRV